MICGGNANSRVEYESTVGRKKVEDGWRRRFKGDKTYSHGNRWIAPAGACPFGPGPGAHYTILQSMQAGAAHFLISVVG